ncbi:MAG TPA: hypothetical protein VIG32_00695 [Candidatus Baltobacteraceae bacterium]|jgi:hypothetical protein
MDHWISSETHQRREELYSYASRARIVRLAESGRSTSFRGRIADGAQAMSDLLAHVAQTVREKREA